MTVTSMNYLHQQKRFMHIILCSICQLHQSQCRDNHTVLMGVNEINLTI